MSRQQLAAALHRMPSIELADLEASAPLLVRRDRKYLFPEADVGRLLERLAGCARVLSIDGRRSFRYESVYFDTPDLASYLDAARRRPWRYKVRTRVYADSGRCLLEIKTRDGRGRTVKERIEYASDLRDVLNDDAVRFVRTCPLVGESVGSLRPTLTTRFSRSTLLLLEGVRLTIDLDFEAVASDGRTVTLPGMAFVETKSRRLPSAADRGLWELGHRPVRVSKFGTSLAALEPGLPANKWTRALRHPWRVAAGTTTAVAS